MARSDVASANPLLSEGSANGSARPGRRAITSRRSLPGSRALVGALLMTLAALGVLEAYRRADAGPQTSVAAAAVDIDAGDSIGSGDLREVPVDLPSTDHAFTDIDSLIGHVALAPIGAGEIIQASAVTGEAASSSGHEVALVLAHDQVAVRRLARGERVDVYVTTEASTSSVVRDVEVVDIPQDTDGTLTGQREVALVVRVRDSDQVAALIHALRNGAVTVVRSTLASDDEPSVTFVPSSPVEDDEP